MDFSSNGTNEIFFVDGAEHSFSNAHFDAFTSAAAHFLEVFNVDHEVDVYISQRSVLHQFDSSARAWHIPPVYDRDNSIICVYVDPKSTIKAMMESLAHEMIHVWQVDRGDLHGHAWKGQNQAELPYQLQPWEIEAHGNQKMIADTFFEDELPPRQVLDKVQSGTEQIFSEIVKETRSHNTKETFKKVAKIAVTLGLGGLIFGA